MTRVFEATFERSGANGPDEMGMRPMQARAYRHRGAQHLLIKSPPASGKSRCLMFIALDKLHNQGVEKCIIAVPEKSIGRSFRNTPLSDFGFWANWEIQSHWNLCQDAETDETESAAKSKVGAVRAFLESPDRVLICTHQTLRFAYKELGVDAFDSCLVAIDEFHHASIEEGNVLGQMVQDLIARNKAHLTAMTGTYFRGDNARVLRQEDEDKFASVTYSYYEQLNGYEHLKTLGLSYHFYSGRYLDSIKEVLDTDKKTIVHIPSVMARESSGPGQKHNDTALIMEAMGEWLCQEPLTGLHHIERADGRVLKVANLVEDDPKKRALVMHTLNHASDRECVDIIIALNMAKEGFDWVWCEHALTIGYRNSLTEIIQIIGRATRDAPGKNHAMFTNMIATPAAEQDDTVHAVNTLLKAISVSLLMEQVMTPRLVLRPMTPGLEAEPRVRELPDGGMEITITGLREMSQKTRSVITQQDLFDLREKIGTDDRVARAQIDPAHTPEFVNQVLISRIIQENLPHLDEESVEEVRQQVVAERNLLAAVQEDGAMAMGGSALMASVRRFINVKDLNIDLIDSINPAKAHWNVLSKDLSGPVLEQIHAHIKNKRDPVTKEEALSCAPLLKRFFHEHGRRPELASDNPGEERLARVMVYLQDMQARMQRKGSEE